MKLAIPVEKSAGLRFNILYTVLLFVAFVAMLIQLIGLHYYAKYEEGFPFSSKWAVGNRQVFNNTYLQTAGNGSPLHYCSNSTYDWILNEEQVKSQGPMNMSNVKCYFLTTEEMTTVKTDEIQVGTFFVETLSDATVRHYFVTEPEKVAVFMNHGIYHPRAGVISLPETTMKNEWGETMAKFSSGDFLSISLGDLAKGIYRPIHGEALLDRKRPDKGYPDESFRFTGVYVLFDIHYANLSPWSTSTDVKCTVTVKHLPNVWGAIGSVGQRYFQGFRIIIKTSTALGYFDGFTTLTYVLSSMVLFGVAQSVSVTLYGLFRAVYRKLKEDAARREADEKGIPYVETADSDSGANTPRGAIAVEASVDASMDLGKSNEIYLKDTGASPMATKSEESTPLPHQPRESPA